MAPVQRQQRSSLWGTLRALREAFPLKGQRRCLVSTVGLCGPLLAATASPALADPCKAISDEGKVPAWLRTGSTFTGTVRYVVDGDGFCVGFSSDPSDWIEVRLANFSAPELSEPSGPRAKVTLSELLLGKIVTCVVTTGRSGRTVSFDRVFAVCRRNDQDVGRLMRSAGVSEGGN